MATWAKSLKGPNAAWTRSGLLRNKTPELSIGLNHRPRSIIATFEASTALVISDGAWGLFSTTDPPTRGKGTSMTTTKTGLVQVRVTARDFMHLWHTSTSWNATFQSHQDEWQRFAVEEDDGTPLVVPTNSDIYWFSDVASVLLARAYVEAQGWDCILASDESVDDSGNCGDWVLILPGITTNYEQSKAAYAKYEAKKKAVMAVWNALDDHHPAPVKTIAKQLGISNYEVAVIVYPPQKFGYWNDDQEPDLD